MASKGMDVPVARIILCEAVSCTLQHIFPHSFIDLKVSCGIKPPFSFLPCISDSPGLDLRSRFRSFKRYFCNVKRLRITGKTGFFGGFCAQAGAIGSASE